MDTDTKVRGKKVSKSAKVVKEKSKEELELEVARANSVMGRLVAQSATPPKEGDVVEGTVLINAKGKVYVDLPPFGTGIMYGREYLNARDVLRKVAVGDTISAKVVSPENKQGYIELSLKEARQALIWSDAEKAIAAGTVFELPVKDANKGGLIIKWQGFQGFLPASQLKPEHYPRVEDGAKDRIYEELLKLVDTPLTVTIISADPKEGKLIFSEKGQGEAAVKGTLIDKYQIGDAVEGEVTGAVDFGVFVKLEHGLEGLVHISEMDWGLVEDPKSVYHTGDKVPVKIIDIKEGKISLSIKALKEDPWKNAASKYKKNDMVRGIIIKYNKHGALASIEEGVAGLVHISEFGSEEKLKAGLELGKAYPFKISLFDATDHRMTLSTKAEMAA